mmetsp:Transcript_11177/g.16776  ORF Transcript_11177/g.16776 Transcript_11177/m.16776 type:complete len:303 (+) Transcript_11177:135-1043(+)
MFDFIGDNFPVIPPESRSVETFRFFSQNVDTLGDNSSTFTATLNFILNTQFDVIALQDVAWSEHCKIDILAQLRKYWTTSLTSPTTSASEPPFIHTWHNTASAPTARPTKTAPYHGGMLAIRAPYSRMVRETINDPRGWGRFGGAVLGNPTFGIAIISIYATGKGSRENDWFQQIMKTQNLLGDDDDQFQSPLALLRHDLTLLTNRLELDNIPTIMCGDWNVCFRDESRQNGDLPHYNSPEWLKWFRLREEDPFVNAFYLRGHPPAYTFNRAGSTSDLDAFIGRQSFLDAIVTKNAASASAM